MLPNKVKIELECFKNNDISIHFNSEVLQDIFLAKSKFPQEKLGGEARALLAASVAECMVSWLAYLLSKSRVKTDFIKASAEAITGLDENKQYIVKEIDVKINVKINGEDSAYQRFENVKNYLLEEGCLMSRSLEKGIKVVFSIDMQKGDSQ
jgi:organic hydroperoxide reductase OsmC/OhrA